MIPLGATVDANGVTVRVFSSRASSLTLCLFDRADAPVEFARIAMTRQGDVWSATAPGGGPGLVYALRSDLHEGLLFDPYGRAFAEPFSWSHGRTPKAAVIREDFTWGDDHAPRTPWVDTVIYEAHVKGFTARHPDVPPSLRGTYAGLASEPAIAHLTSLGVTAVELLPVHARVDEPALHRRGLTNYWGYNTLGFFAPEPRLAAATTPQGVVDEFKAMVRALHAAGIEVILDVVYNHTAEGDHTGPTLSFKGLDPEAYYRLDPANPLRHRDVTGCGNTMDMRVPVARRLVLDSLRYWVQHMHVDGFRFDLASALARTDEGVDPRCGLFADILQDPILATVKLIAEPWDATAEGYAPGRFPPGWAEWNGMYRDDARRYWRGDGSRARLATRLAGSSDVFDASRGPSASINFVTSHDGFTLADLVSYRHKHNQANGEDNRDGDDNNHSDNGGVEGPTTDPEIRAQRARRQRALLHTLFASLGVPMLNGGDELGRTQHGNNNAYCHDSPLSWTPWLEEHGADLHLLRFVQALAAWRRETPALRRTTFFPADGPDVMWLRLDGTPMTSTDWTDPHEPGFIMRLGDHDIVFDPAGVLEK